MLKRIVNSEKKKEKEKIGTHIDKERSTGYMSVKGRG
jgi:predicted transcriptional regulator